jgi:hypothetical protein
MKDTPVVENTESTMMSTMRSSPDDAMLSWSPNARISPVPIVEGGRTDHFLKRGSIPEPSNPPNLEKWPVLSSGTGEILAQRVMIPWVRKSPERIARPKDVHSHSFLILGRGQGRRRERF